MYLESLEDVQLLVVLLVLASIKAEQDSEVGDEQQNYSNNPLHNRMEKSERPSCCFYNGSSRLHDVPLKLVRYATEEYPKLSENEKSIKATVSKKIKNTRDSQKQFYRFKKIEWRRGDKQHSNSKGNSRETSGKYGFWKFCGIK